jgi:hypothetical protein
LDLNEEERENLECVHISKKEIKVPKRTEEPEKAQEALKVQTTQKA